MKIPLRKDFNDSKPATLPNNQPRVSIWSDDDCMTKIQGSTHLQNMHSCFFFIFFAASNGHWSAFCFAYQGGVPRTAHAFSMAALRFSIGECHADL